MAISFKSFAEEVARLYAEYGDEQGHLPVQFADDDGIIEGNAAGFEMSGGPWVIVESKGWLTD